jgi:hypothetical protein
MNKNIIDREYRTYNIKRFDKNRKKLLGIIFKKQSFTINEIYENMGEDTIIDSQESIKDFLQDMVYSGFLQLSFGIYTLQ